MGWDSTPERDQDASAKSGSDVDREQTVESSSSGSPDQSIPLGAPKVAHRETVVGSDLPPPPGHSSRWPKIPDFLITGLIGAGGMGTVYLAKQRHPKRTVAIKVMNPGVSSAAALRRFEFETQVLARLTHPNIAAIYEAGTFDDGVGETPYFAMEYISPVRSITDYVRKIQPGVRVCVKLIIQACHAVGYAHSMGVIHRDLKPGNLLVNADARIKVIDFGVARASDPDVSSLATRVDALVGTLQYMSPEQCASDTIDLTAASDVYALGVTLYQLLTGQLPYTVSNMGLASAVRVITEESHRSLSAIDPHLRGDLDVIVGKAMSREPADRYRNASDLGDDLQRYLDQEQILASTPTIVTTLKRVVRRNRSAVLAATTIVLLLVVASVSGVLALVNSNRALTSDNRAYAEQLEKQKMVSGLLAYFMRDTYNMFAGLSANPELREQFVENSMVYINQLRAEGTGDPALQKVIAEALWQAGNNAWSQRAGSRGEIDRAIEFWTNGATVLEELRASPGGDVELDLLAIDMQSSLYEAAMELSERTSAEAALIAMEQLTEGLPDVERDEDQWGRAFQTWRHRFRFSPPPGDPMQDSRTAAMAALIDRGQTTLASEDGSVPTRVLRNATLFWNTVGYGYTQMGDLEQALGWYQRSLEARERIMAGGGGRSEQNFTRRDLNYSRLLVADAMAGLGRTEETLSLMQNRVLPSSRLLVQENPQDSRSRRDLAVTMTELTEYLLAAGQASAAVASAAEARQAWSRWAAMSDHVITDFPRSTREGIRIELLACKAHRLLSDQPQVDACVQRAVTLATLGSDRWPQDHKLQKQVASAMAFMEASGRAP